MGSEKKTKRGRGRRLIKEGMAHCWEGPVENAKWKRPGGDFFSDSFAASVGTHTFFPGQVLYKGPHALFTAPLLRFETA